MGSIVAAYARNPFRALDLSHAGIVRVVIAALSVAMVVYHMGAILWGTSEALIFRGTHLLFALALTFLIYRRTGSSGEDGRPTPLDYMLLALALAPVLYLFANYDYVVNRIYYIDDLERFQRTLNRPGVSQFRIGFPDDGRSGAA